MVVFNIIGNQTSSQSFAMELKDVHFGLKESVTDFIISGPSNIIDHNQMEHEANQVDGTDIGMTSLTADIQSIILPIQIANKSNHTIELDDLELNDRSGSFITDYFEPQSIQAGDVLTLDITYHPHELPKLSVADLTIHLVTAHEYYSIPIQLKAKSICPENDLISTADIIGENTREVYRAISALQIEAKIQPSRSLQFSSEQEIKLSSGFEIPSNSAMQISISNVCSSQ